MEDPGALKLRFDQNGRLANLDYLYPAENSSTRLAECGSFFEPGGALGCAGKKFEEADCCLEEIACYVSFIPCLVTRVLDCIINGCN